MVQLLGDLPIPVHFSLWQAENPTDWAMSAQQCAHLPTFVFEVIPGNHIGRFDQFQSSVLIAAHYNHFDRPAIYLASPTQPAIEHLLDDSPTTKHGLLTAKLLQTVPIRALLAVSGESWILSEKVSSLSDRKSVV